MSNKKSYKIQSYWANIVCPFFHNDNINSIVCEGFSEDTVIRHTFRSKGEREEWEKKYCYGIKECESCPVYRLSSEKYKE